MLTDWKVRKRSIFPTVHHWYNFYEVPFGLTFSKKTIYEAVAWAVVDFQALARPEDLFQALAFVTIWLSGRSSPKHFTQGDRASKNNIHSLLASVIFLLWEPSVMRLGGLCSSARVESHVVYVSMMFRICGKHVSENHRLSFVECSLNAHCCFR